MMPVLRYLIEPGRIDEAKRESNPERDPLSRNDICPLSVFEPLHANHSDHRHNRTSREPLEKAYAKVAARRVTGEEVKNGCDCPERHTEDPHLIESNPVNQETAGDAGNSGGQHVGKHRHPGDFPRER